MVKTKYHYFNIGLTQNFMNEIRKECYILGISKQDFIRALCRDYFLRNHGRDITLQKNEKLRMGGNDE
jgi:hypothetical protein